MPKFPLARLGIMRVLFHIRKEKEAINKCPAILSLPYLWLYQIPLYHFPLLYQIPLYQIPHWQVRYFIFQVISISIFWLYQVPLYLILLYQFPEIGYIRFRYM